MPCAMTLTARAAGRLRFSRAWSGSTRRGSRPRLPRGGRASAWLDGVCAGRVRKLSVCQEVVERGLDGVHHGVVVAARGVGSLATLLEHQCGAILVNESKVVDVGGELLGKVAREELCPRAFRTGAGGCKLTHHPLVGLVCDVERGDGAPAHGAGDGVAYRAAGGVREQCANGREVRRVEGGVAGRAHEGALGAAARVAKREDALGAAGDGGGVVAQVAHGGLEVGDAPGRAAGEARAVRVGAVAATSAPGLGVDEPGLWVVREAVCAVLGGRGLGRVAGRVHGDDHGSRRRGEVAHSGG